MKNGWMKVWLFTLVFIMLAAVAAHALVGEYRFTSAIGAYTDITGGTILGTGAHIK